MFIASMALIISNNLYIFFHSNGEDVVSHSRCTLPHPRKALIRQVSALFIKTISKSMGAVQQA